MGQTYSVEMKVKLKDENGAAKALKNMWRKDFEGRYPDEQLDSFDELVRFMLADNQNMLYYEFEDGWHYYNSGFDATYSWDCLLDDWFKAIVPYLEDGSRIDVWPDFGYWRNVVVNGKGVDEIVRDLI